jgi:hypothetical protein
MVTINDAMPFCILINHDSEVSLMSLHDFLTLQIRISILTRRDLSEGLVAMS